MSSSLQPDPMQMIDVSERHKSSFAPAQLLFPRGNRCEVGVAAEFIVNRQLVK